MKRLVADTGPVLHLHEAGALHLLPLIGETFVPPLVVVELRSKIPALPPKWAKLQALSSTAQQRALEWRRAGLLHGGEAEALALAREFKSDWFLADDAAARLMAESLNIEVHGSIGVVLWAAANKLVKKTEAESFLAGLEKSSLWMSLKVRFEARAALEKLFSHGASI
jgi:predicted nucleic acid-binding protein